MLDKNLLYAWKDTLSARPTRADTFRGMHLYALPQATRQQLESQLLRIHFETNEFLLCELKGCPKELIAFKLPQTEGETLWLCLQFHGTLTFPTGKVSTYNSFLSFTSAEEEYLVTIPAEKQWVLFLGIRGVSRQQLLAEQPKLREWHIQQESNITPPVPLSYLERKALEQFSKNTFGPFSSTHHIGLLLWKLYSSYIQQLDRQNTPSKEAGLIPLYHQAISYITEHYMDADLNRVTIADALHCSTRSLSRAFEGRTTNLNASITLIRLYKARELLKEKPELSVEYIAGMLHFPHAQHFANQYKKHFRRTPREERKR